MRLKEDIRPVTEFRAKTASLIDQIQQTKRALVLTQRGHSAAVVIDVDEYERLIEEVELLRDIHKAEQQLSRGEGVTHEAAREQVLKALA